MQIFFYMASIAVANVLTARLAPLVLFGGMLIIPVGSLFVGATFILRDLVQLRHGRRGAYIAIAFALVLSAAMSLSMGDTAHVAAASAVAFFVSEAIDTEIFSRLRRHLLWRVVVSGIIGGIADSTIFVVLGLSPIGGNMIGWEQVPPAIVGQIAAKAFMQLLAVAILAKAGQQANSCG